MFTIPLAFTGGFFALFVTDNEVGVVSMIGFVMLAGVIVNNGIVLVDYINQLRREGMDKKEAIVTAGRTRTAPDLNDGTDHDPCNVHDRRWDLEAVQR